MLHPSLHPVLSIGFYPLAPRNLDAIISDLASSVKATGVHDPISITRVDGELLCFKGVRTLQAAKAAGIELIPGIVYEGVTEQEILIRIAGNVLHTKSHNAFEKYRLLKNVQAKYGITKNVELAKLLFIPEPRVTKLLRLDNLSEENRTAAELRKLGSELLYYLASRPKAEHAKLIEESKKTRCKVFVKTYSHTRTPTVKKSVRQEHFATGRPDVAKLDLQPLKKATPEQVAEMLDDTASAVRKYAEQGLEWKEIWAGVNLELRLKYGKVVQHA